MFLLLTRTDSILETNERLWYFRATRWTGDPLAIHWRSTGEPSGDFPIQHVV